MRTSNVGLRSQRSAVGSSRGHLRARLIPFSSNTTTEPDLTVVGKKHPFPFLNSSYFQALREPVVHPTNVDTPARNCIVVAKGPLLWWSDTTPTTRTPKMETRSSPFQCSCSSFPFFPIFPIFTIGDSPLSVCYVVSAVFRVRLFHSWLFCSSSTLFSYFRFRLCMSRLITVA